MGSYVKLSERLYFGIHPQAVEPIGIPLINHYVSLVERHEFPFEPKEYHKFPIKDRGAPSLTQLKRIIDFLMGLEGVIYLFCKGGHGRSGTVAAALYGKMNGLSGKESLKLINKEWHKQRDLTKIRPFIVKLGSPQTACQKRLVLNYLDRLLAIKSFDF